MTDKKNTTGGLGVSDVLLIIFITLKITGIITWSWVWVLSPLWISSALVIVTLLFLVIIGMICEKKEDK
jgi:membrane protein YdbS with pleckstrin-like domain